METTKLQIPGRTVSPSLQTKGLTFAVRFIALIRALYTQGIEILFGRHIAMLDSSGPWVVSWITLFESWSWSQPSMFALPNRSTEPPPPWRLWMFQIVKLENTDLVSQNKSPALLPTQEVSKHGAVLQILMLRQKKERKIKGDNFTNVPNKEPKARLCINEASTPP